MSTPPPRQRSTIADAIFQLLDPIPFGCFVAGLLFDIIYWHSPSAEIMWIKGAAWLIAFGLLFAVIPRLINLAQVWITRRRTAGGADRIAFWLNLLAIVAAIFNALVHSRDAYATMPTALWLSAVTVILLALAHIVTAVRHSTSGDRFRG